MDMELNYTLSEKNTKKIKETLEKELKMIKKCDKWRKINNINSLSYNLSWKFK